MHGVTVKSERGRGGLIKYKQNLLVTSTKVLDNPRISAVQGYLQRAKHVGKTSAEMLATTIYNK